MKTLKLSMTVVAVALACVGNAYATSAADCNLKNGYQPSQADSTNTVFTPGDATANLTTTYGAVLAAATSITNMPTDSTEPPTEFLTWAGSQYTSNNSTACTVKEVQPSSKAKPTVRYVNWGARNSEECSLLNSTSAIWSKLSQGKFSDAWQVNYTMMGKIDTIVASGKLTPAAGKAIKDQATQVGTCIANIGL